jgi:hypothetical protein
MDAVNAALDYLLSFVRSAPGIALAAALGGYLLLLVLTVVLLVRQARMARTQRRLLRGADGQSIELLLLEHADEMHRLRDQVTRAHDSGQSNAAGLQQCLQRVGVVRYDAFADIGGRQSFSLALLDAQGSGLVLSGLHSRHDMRIYAKPVAGGASPVALTGEEREAIAAATAGGAALVDKDGAVAGAGGRNGAG